MLKNIFLVLIAVLVMTSCTTVKTSSAFKLVAKTNWVRQTTAEEYIGPKLIHSMSPAIVNDIVFQGNAFDGIVALDRKSGHLLWRHNIKNGVNAGVAVKNDIVYFGANDGQFYAVKAAKGQIVWTFPTQTESSSRPVVDDSSVYFLTNNGTLYSLDLKTGKQNWSYIQKDNAQINIWGSASPVIEGNFLYIGFNDGTVAAFDKTKGFLKWERNLSVAQERFHDISATPVISGENIFVTNYSGGLFCMKKVSGEIVWKTDEGAASGANVQGNRVYYSTISNKVVSLDKQTGKTIWFHKLKEGVGTKPVFFKEMLLVGTSEGPLEILSSDTGELLKTYSTGWGISADISLNPDTNDIFIMSDYGNVYSIRLSWIRPQQEWPWEDL